MCSQMITYHEVIFWITTLLCPAGWDIDLTYALRNKRKNFTSDLHENTELLQILHSESVDS